MSKFSEEQMQKIQKAIEGSYVWETVNAKIKAAYEQNGRTPCDEEYQAMRTMIICKTVLEDENVMEVLSKNLWESLQN